MEDQGKVLSMINELPLLFSVPSMRRWSRDLAKCKKQNGNEAPVFLRMKRLPSMTISVCDGGSPS
jgi:hypothetical protein